MTAVIGFFGNGSITVATDSQMTCGGTKQCDSKKIDKIEFQSGQVALVARAGAIETADLFLEIFEEMAAVNVENWRTIANVAETALKETRKRLLDGYRHEALSAEHCREYLSARYGEFLIAYMFGGQPHMFRADSEGAVAIKVSTRFTAMGSGRNIASLLLEGSHFLHLNQNERAGLAAYVIEMCKRADLYCSGQVQIGDLNNVGKGYKIYEPEEVEKMQAAVVKTHHAVQSRLGKLITANFKHPS